MDDKITLDRKTFKALAADTRISILKELNIRRKTQTELANTLGMSISTIKEHLDNLESVDLVKQIDEGYKWKYYELTKKGKNIISPTETRIFISLALALLALTLATKNLLAKLATPMAGGQPMLKAVAESSQDLVRGAAENMAEQAPQSAIPAAGYTGHMAIPYSDIILVIALAIILGILIGYLLKSRR
ncbi:MAG: winged helix-turn-helix domain-containing protein [archaeon]